MAKLASINSATPNLQSSLIQSRLTAARREMAQAQAEVQDLRSQADAAETVFEQRRAQVSTLSGQARQADPTYRSSLSGSSKPLSTAQQQTLANLNRAPENTYTPRTLLQLSLASSNPDLLQNSTPPTRGRYVNLTA